MTSTKWKNRIAGYGEEAPDQLLANPFNFRVHPKRQQDALTGALDEIGWIQDIVVNRVTGHVLDGHLRIALSLRKGEATVPVKYIDLTEDEEKLALAIFDPITNMAETDAAILDELLQDVNTGEAALQALLATLAEDAGIVPPDITIPEPKEQREPELKAECFIEIYCSNADLRDFQGILDEWAERTTVTVNIS